MTSVIASLLRRKTHYPQINAIKPIKTVLFRLSTIISGLIEINQFTD